MLLLIFQIQSRWYALEASQVAEIIPRVHLREVPNAPDFVSGLLNYRGMIIPVIDLGTFLEGNAAAPYLSTRIMIIQYPTQSPLELDTFQQQPKTKPRMQYLGLIAEKITETLDRSPSDILDPTLPTQPGHYLGGMLLDDRGMIQYLGIDKLVKNIGYHPLLGLLSSSS